ncbi:MAG: tRNA (adenosine(37)-N6)-threonylcarbamoyltransferase complex dimerization subunit type 1 TsaB [Phycisphaeraceae bacterium]
MTRQAVNLAIETSSRQGAIGVGRGDELLETRTLGKQRRHEVGLLPGIDALFRDRKLNRTELGEVYVSAGPGSFTGLRVAIAAAKMLALAGGAKVVALPTLDVIAQNVPAPDQGGPEQVAACLNLKRGTVHSGIYTWRDGGWRLQSQAKLRTLAELLAEAGRPVWLVGERLPELPDPLPEGAEVAGPGFALPRAEAVWRLGRERAKAGAFDDPGTLTPMYIREPEAVTLWREREEK